VVSGLPQDGVGVRCPIGRTHPACSLVPVLAMQSGSRPPHQARQICGWDKRE
jgi:hypothetical protein